MRYFKALASRVALMSRRAYMHGMKNGQGNSPAIAAPPPRRSGRVPAPKRVRRRAADGRTIDGRLASAKRWRALLAGFTVRTGGRHPELCAALASLIVRREMLDAAVMRAEPVDTDLLMRLSGEIRRLMTKLGLDEEPAEDGTQRAIDALHTGRDEALAR
jgi:hypothetical protein